MSRLLGALGVDFSPSLLLRVFGDEGAIVVDLDRAYNELRICRGRDILPLSNGDGTPLTAHRLVWESQTFYLHWAVRRHPRLPFFQDSQTGFTGG